MTQHLLLSRLGLSARRLAGRRWNTAVLAVLLVLLPSLIPLSVVRAQPASSAPSTPSTQGTTPAAVESTIRANLDEWLQGRVRIDSVRSTPVPGLYEVFLGGELIYVDAAGRYGFIEGQLIEFKGNRNLTQERLEAINAIDFKTLPLNLAIKQVLGKGTRSVAVFEDPNCPHCRNLRRDLLTVPDLTIYTFPYPILSPDSQTKSRQAWCASDRVKAWNELVLQNKVPVNNGGCETPIEQVLELGRRLRISGTPTLFLENGRRIPGSLPAERLIRAIDEAGRRS